MKFYDLDTSSGNIVRSFPKIKIQIEVVCTAEFSNEILKFQREVDNLLISMNLRTIDSTSRRYLDNSGEIELFYRKVVFILEK